jgi:general secretion pathway protein G
MTLLEIMIVTTIVATLASIGSAMYGSALKSARFTKARQELRMISLAITQFRGQNEGALPETLEEVGHGGRLDPWGYPYMYLNFHSGTGSGMQFVTDSGLVDPVAVIEIKKKVRMVDLVKVDVLKSVSTKPRLSKASVTTRKRKDRLLFPLNTDYDLFSVGPNGKSLAALGENFSLDDVIRADDGDFFGVASSY